MPDDPNEEKLGANEDDSTSAAPSSSSSNASNCLSWDFRNGTLPDGVSVTGEHEFVPQRDGSTAIAMGAHSFLDVALNAAGVGGKMINSYTISMDVKLDRMPTESMTLLQTKSEASRVTEGEAFIYSDGGVGVFGEGGVADNIIQPDKWVRVTITLGAPPAPEPKRSAGGRGGLGGRGNLGGIRGGRGGMSSGMGMDVDGDGSDDEYRPNNRYSSTGSNSSSTGERVLTTYINAKKCAVISSFKRGVVGQTDGRMAINPVGFSLFQSNNPKTIPGGVQIRYVEVNPTKCLKETEIKSNAQRNRIFSTYEKDKQAQLASIRSSLTLSSVYRKPPPIWLHPTLLSAFGDVYLDNTGLTSGNDICTSASILGLTIERLVLHRDENGATRADAMKQPNLLGEFSHSSVQSMSYVLAILKSLKTLTTPFNLAIKNGAPQLVHFLRKVKQQLNALTEGSTMFLPGGIGSTHPVLYVIEKEAELFRFAIINTDPNFGLDYHLAHADTAPKIKYQTIMVIKNVAPAKIMDDAFWGMVYKLAILPPDKFNKPVVLYDVLLPFLVDKPLEQILSESEQESVIDYKTPQRSSTAAYRCLLQGCAYVLRRQGLDAVDVKRISFCFKLQMLLFVQHDLQFVQEIHDSDKRVIAMICQQTAHNAVKLGKDDRLSMANLNYVYSLIDSLEGNCQKLPCIDSDASNRLPELNLKTSSADMVVVGSGPSASNAYQLEHPFMERLLRTDDVDGLAGTATMLPRYIPVNILQLPVKVENLEDAVAAIRYCDRLCTLIMVQGQCVKNQCLHIVSLVQYVTTQLLPIPKPLSVRADSMHIEGDDKPVSDSCIWSAPMRYGLQLDLCIVLERILEHFIAAVFSLHATKSLDALKLIIPAAIASFVDVLLRKVSIDQPSEFCLHLIGANNSYIPGGRGAGFGLNLESFGSQSETIEMHTPELNIARTAIIDYFESQYQLPLNKLFNWDQGHRFEETVGQFLAGVCSDLAFPVSDKHLISYMITPNALINKNYPEFHIYRNVAFYMKYVQNVDPRAFPRKSHYMQSDVELKWKFEEGQFLVMAFAQGFALNCYPSPPFDKMKHRYPSAALPSFLASPHEITTEDDVLHIKNLPSFDDCLGQQDSELLLSYLTVPYIRIPLILAMFATEDRIHALKSETLQQVVDAVLFEPSKYLPCSLSGVEPKYVPSENKKCLATAYGVLLNELHRSPEIVIRSVIQLIKFALGVDVGNVHSNTIPIILYVFRLAARFESSVCFLIQYKEKNHPSMSSTVRLRDVEVSADVLRELRSGLLSIRELLYDKAHRLLDSWQVQLMVECEEAKASINFLEKGPEVVTPSHADTVVAVGEREKLEIKDESGKIIDRNTIISCQLHAHLLLVYRNISLDEFTNDVVSTLTSSVVFLTTRHTWNMDLLGIPEHEVFELLSVQRRNLVMYSRRLAQRDANSLFESIVQVSVGVGIRKSQEEEGEAAGADMSSGMRSNDNSLNSSTRRWGHVKGNHNVGRFTVASVHRNGKGQSARAGGVVHEDSVQEVDEAAQELGIEVDLQVFQVTLKSSHLQALDTVIAANPDVQLIFKESKSMQASVVQSTENRMWVHLIGRAHDIQYWCTPDDRTCLQTYDRDYAPGDLFDSEQWIVPLLEPVRLTYMTEPFVLQICMQEHPLPKNAEVAHLIGIHPKQGGTWKEIFVHRHTGVVQVFHLLSHGRRFYRVLEYTTNVKYGLREMQPSLDHRRSPWPVWERYGSNSHPYEDHWGDSRSCVITRSWEFTENLSGGTETFLPARLLYGIVPQVLLDNFLFWQDEEDNVRGYPMDATTRSSAHSIYGGGSKKGKKLKKGETDGDSDSDDGEEEEAADNTTADNAGSDNASAFAPYLILLTLKSTDHVKYTCLSGITGEIRRVLRKNVDKNMKVLLEVVDVLDNCSIIEKENWKIDFKLFSVVKRFVAAFSTGAKAIQMRSLVGPDADETVISSVVVEKARAFVSEIETLNGQAGGSLFMYDNAEILIKEISLSIDKILASAETSCAALTPIATAKSAAKLPVDQVDVVLINLANAYNDSVESHGGKFGSIMKMLSRIENASYILCWTRAENVDKAEGATDYAVDLVECPRLKVSFEEKLDNHGVPRLYSMDHVNLFIANNNRDSSELISNKLLVGMPHGLLMSTNNNENQILVPVIDVVRPIIGSNPFTTELVMNRNESPEWYAALDTCYYLYSVHVSLAFLFSSTLASSMYLLSLRFHHRQYDEVFRLSESIGTDAEFSPEEMNIFKSLKRLGNDHHPDAHACRLKISLVTIDAPVYCCPWDLTVECSKYVTKLNHVSAGCRISFEEELQLLELCVCDSADPRFYDPETQQPKYTVYQVTLVKNRKHYLNALLSQNFIAETFLPPRSIGTDWANKRNSFVLMACAGGPESYSSFYSGLEVNYAVPPAVSGHAVYQVIDKFYTWQEDVTGTYSGGLGFLFLYELFTGTKKAKFGDLDISASLASILLQFLSDKDSSALLPSILSLLHHHPHLRQIFPKFQDNRQTKGRTIKGIGDDLNPISPLGTLLEQCMVTIQTEYFNLLVPLPNESCTDHPSQPETMCAVLAPEDREWIIPVVSDYSCGMRTLTEVTATCADGKSRENLVTTSDELQQFATQPLKSLNLDTYIAEITRRASNLSDISPKLPFDVSEHNQSKSVVALSMLKRLKVDMEEFATTQNNMKIPKLLGLSVNIYDLMDIPTAEQGTSSGIMTEAAFTEFSKTAQLIELLIGALVAVRELDEKYSLDALNWLNERANFVRDEAGMSVSSSIVVGDVTGEPVEDKEKLMYLLRRKSHQEPTLWLEIIFATLLSSEQVADLQRLNPFLSEQVIGEMTDITVSAILHANRIGQINRCLADARDIQGLLKRITDTLPGSSVSQTFVASAILKSENLANNLIIGRHYVDAAPSSCAADVSSTCTSYNYDPRFLLFEFTWNILLRKSQVRMVRDYVHNIQSGQSAVKQMIMGAGKTTVVCPLLTLLLGDGKNLIVQVVPPALLEFSRSIMRSTFSSIMHKRIYTLTFDRSTEINSSVYRKLCASVTNRGVVICTPTTIKSIMLKFLELADLIRDNSQKHSLQLEKDCQELGRTLQLFQESILIMDEVDLILHPLKSELNFPIGPKQELDASPRRWLLPIHIIDSIFFIERGKMSVNFKQSSRAMTILEQLKVVIENGYRKRALQRNPHLILLNVDWYHAEMKPALIDWAYLWLESQHIASVLHVAQLHEYVMTDTSTLSGKTATGFPCAIAAVVRDNVSVEHRKILNLVRNWLNSYLPHILTKIDRVSFGIMNHGDYERALKTDPHMPRTRAKLAIPFVGKDVPSRSSEFAHPDVIIGLTVLAYRYEGLRWTDFEDIIANLRSTVTKEMGPWHLRKSSIRFQKWIEEAGGYIKGTQANADAGETDADVMMELLSSSPSKPLEPGSGAILCGGKDAAAKEVVSLRLLKRSNDEQMKRIYRLIRFLPDCLHFYMENFIFPVYMDNKVTKISAAGQELGGEMLFKRRIGFSGTPSDLLPVELGKCEYERGSDGQMIHVMTSKRVCSYEVIRENWSPLSILQMIANPSTAGVRYHALIDTGALITGLTNYEVAKVLLYRCDHLSSWCEGVVFLDEYDRKMILVKATGRVVKLQQCGIPVEKRFAFYDQVHTTGMDISHVINAKAILTLSKDMVFRDFAQGAYRMRGISRGQTIHILVIPEVRDLIVRELRKCGEKYTTGAWEGLTDASTTDRATGYGVLQDITAWLIVNSARSERIQYNLLCIQNASNIWRKLAFSSLLKRREEFKVNSSLLSSLDEVLNQQLTIFCEDIPFILEADIPSPVTLMDCVLKKVEQLRALVPLKSEQAYLDVLSQIHSWIIGHAEDGVVPTDASAAAERLRLAAGPHGGDDTLEELNLGAEMVQEQEQEKEQQQEQEQEQEIEIEKYVDLAYSREHEEPTPWLFSSLAEGLDSDNLEQFYKANEFKLYKRKPIAFPDYLHVSNNYFNKKWSGARRIKNVVMVMEVVHDVALCAPTTISFQESLTEKQEYILDTALELFHHFDTSSGANTGVTGTMHANYKDDSDGDSMSSGGSEEDSFYTALEVEQILKAFCHIDISRDREWVTRVLDQYNRQQRKSTSSPSGASPESNKRQRTDDEELTVESLRDEKVLKELMLSGVFNQVEKGRNFVTISLAEAETIRRIMHIRKSDEEMGLIPSSKVSIALRCQAADNVILDRSNGFLETEQMRCPCPFMTRAAFECFRFLNCDMFFSDVSINILLRSLFLTTRYERRAYFKQILGCRRRLTKKWTDAPVTKLFTLRDHYGLLKQRSLALTIRHLIRSKGLLFYDAFTKFDYDRNGFLSPGEVWGGLQYLGLDTLTAQDVLDFISFGDVDRDGNISYKEFIEVLYNPLCEEGSSQTTSNTGGVSGGADAERLESSAPEDYDLSPAVSMGLGSRATSPDAGPTLARQPSFSAVTPVGEEELKLLQYANQKEEESEETAVESQLEEEEARRQEELQEEEELLDLTQAGGANPKINELTFLIQYNFRTGKLPRHVSSRGDTHYKADHNNTSSVPSTIEESDDVDLSAFGVTDGTVYFMRVFQAAMLFIAFPPILGTSGPGAFIPGGVGTLGGTGLNQYTAIMEIMVDKIPTGSGSSPSAVPLFSNAGYGEKEALLWLHSNGCITASATNSFTPNRDSSNRPTADSLPKLQVNKWTVLSIVVDGGHGDGKITVYMNDNEASFSSFAPKGIEAIDGDFGILENRVTVFGSKDLKQCQGGNIRNFCIFPRVLASAEISVIARDIIQDSNTNILNTITSQLVSMGFTEAIAHWAASNTSGATIEEHVMNAFSMLSADDA